MLLNYLYTNFIEDTDLAPHLGISLADLRDLITARIFPQPSYIYTSTSQVRSFMGEAQDKQVYRFHLRGMEDWFKTVQSLGLSDETQARGHFCARYDAARSAFLQSDLGAKLNTLHPAIAVACDENAAHTSWSHFLVGTYGVCTRDARPETIFLKEIYVKYVQAFMAHGPDTLSSEHQALLRETVDRLDLVTSDFAPHEVAHSSRQRCIIDIRKLK